MHTFRLLRKPFVKLACWGWPDSTGFAPFRTKRLSPRCNQTCLTFTCHPFPTWGQGCVVYWRTTWIRTTSTWACRNTFGLCSWVVMTQHQPPLSYNQKVNSQVSFKRGRHWRLRSRQTSFYARGQVRCNVYVTTFMVVSKSIVYCIH